MGGKEKVRVAVVQAAPVFMDKQKTIEKACKLITEAGNNGAELIIFSEVFIPGYPAIYTGGWDSKPSEWGKYMIALQDNSVVINSRDVEPLREASQEASAYTVIGCNELDDRQGSRTIYNCLLFIGKDGKVMGRHRKLMPTYIERTYWGCGDASDLKVFDTDIGRIGSLICGENTMVLMKAAMMQKGEEFHITVWPGAWSGQGKTHLFDPETDSSGGSCLVYPVIRSYAIESQAFVVGSLGILTQNDFPERWRFLKDNDHVNYSWLVGGSTVIDPHGRFMVGPVIGEEKILYADCYANQIKLAKALLDCLGHYTRWDLVQLQVRSEPWTPEVEIPKKIFKQLPLNELRRISQEYAISLDKLEGIIEELNKLFPN